MPRTLATDFDVKLLRQRISQRMEGLGTNPKAVAREAGLGDTAVYDIVVRHTNNSPSISHLRAIAHALQCDVGYLIGEQNFPSVEKIEFSARIPIVGFAEAGAFRRMVDYDQSVDNLRIVHAPRSRSHPGARHFALEVRGDSMNVAKPTPIVEGMYVLCVDMISAELTIESGQIYAVRRTIDGGSTWECTVKRAKVYRDRTELLPESTNPNHEKIVIPRDLDSTHANEIAAIGWVYGTYNSFES